MMPSPRLILVKPPAALTAREYPIHPLAGVPPRQDAGNVPLAPDLAGLRTKREAIQLASQNHGYWVTTTSFVPQEPFRVIDFDFLLHAIVGTWLSRQVDHPGELTVDLRMQVLQLAQNSPLKLRLMDNEGKAFSPGPQYPLTVEKKMIDRARKLAAAGFLHIEHDFTRSGGAGYLVQPTYAGMARAWWVAELLELPLPVLN